jgi:putative phosphoribosyl transferase
MFADRTDAGRQLARKLDALRGSDVVVVGLPRGGVPVAAEVAAALDAPLDVVVVRKLGVPAQPELAMGAIGEDGVVLIDQEIVAYAGVTPSALRAIEQRERGALEARVHLLRHGRSRVDLAGKTVVVVDDGLATGASARAACEVVRRMGAARVIVAVPVAPARTVRTMTEADAVVCVDVPDRFLAVGAHYRDFTPTTEDEVVVLLDSGAGRGSGA